MLIDTHVHLISPDERAYPLQPAGLPGEWYREAPVSAESFVELMDQAGVDRAAAVQPLGAYSYDNRYAADSAERFPNRLFGVCSVDVGRDDAVGALEYWIRKRGMAAVRIFALAGEQPSRLDDPKSFPVWVRAIELGVPIVVTILRHQLAQLGAVLRRFRDAPVLLDHCGFPELHGPPWDSAAELFELAELENLHLKVSTNVLDEAAREGRSAEFVNALATRFSAGRLLWGSDFSQTHDRSYAELVSFGRQAFAELDEDDRALCLGGTAQRLWPAP